MRRVVSQVTLSWGVRVSPENIPGQCQHISGQSSLDVIWPGHRIPVVGLAHWFIAELPHKVIPQLGGVTSRILASSFKYGG